MNNIHAFMPRGLQQDVLFRNIVCLTAVAVLVWEYILTVHDEYRFIWRGSTNRVKMLYLFSRYTTMAIHASNTYLVFGPLSQLPVDRYACMGWFILLTIGACLLLACIDALVILRVYVLYNRSAFVAVSLTMLMFTQFGLVAMCTSRTLSVVPFSDTCDVLKTPHDVVYIMASVIVTQAVLLGLTLAKRTVAFGSSPVVHIIVHDGARIFVLIVSMWMTIIPYSIFTQVSKPHIVFVWPIVLMSIATCRFIMHMQQLPLEVIEPNGSSTGMSTVVLTSFVASLEDVYATTATSWTGSPMTEICSGTLPPISYSTSISQASTIQIQK